MKVYSLSFFKNFSSDDFLINADIINKLIQVSKITGNSVLKIKENEEVLYKFCKSKYVTNHVKVLTDTEKLLINIKSLLNKATGDNVSEISKKIETLITGITDIEIFKIIFETSYKNYFYSETYAMLVFLLTKQNEDFRNFVIENSQKMYLIVENLSYSSSDNYNDFCDDNKKSEERMALCCFYANLCLLDFLEMNIMIHFIEHLLNNVNNFIEEENKKSEVDEILDIVYSLLNILKIPFTNEIINKLSKSTNKSFKSLSSKSIFKCMDILEL